MIQVVNSGGRIVVVEVPEPSLQSGGALVRTSHSLISSGTETAGLGKGVGGHPLVAAVRNPNLVRKVLDRARSQGIRETAGLVRARISSQIPMGYSCSGVVLEPAPDLKGFRPGDRVVCAGAGFANHAAINFVPRNLMARLPDDLSFPEGAFATLAAIALQGVRRAGVEIGERVLVVGLGLLGQLTAQLLKASGCVTIGVDTREERVERALGLGLDAGFGGDRDLSAAVLELTGRRGADAVIVTAAGDDGRLLNRCFDACRKKGRLVLVGDVPIRVSRDKIYKKELDFRISTSYGPGRYDPEYEERGRDYPYAYVRWTEGRNLEEVCRLMAARSLRVQPLMDALFSASEADQAYSALRAEPPPVAVLLDYGLQLETASARIRRYPATSVPLSPSRPGVFGVGVVGLGSYFRSTLLPLLKKHAGFKLVTACTRDGLSARMAVERDGFSAGVTDVEETLSNPMVQVVYIATRHDRHYQLAKRAIEADKVVFVEKPMTMTPQEGLQLVDLVRDKGAILTCGFNRRFSPHARRLKEALRERDSPKTMIYRIDAGALPDDHWLLDPILGGGRLLGEGVHFFDFLRFLADSDPVRVEALSPRGRSGDEASVLVEYGDGSVGVVVYSGSGSGGAGKERLEVLASGQTLVLDDFRSLEIHGGSHKGSRTRVVEKGQLEQLENLHRALLGKEPLGVTVEDGYWATWCATAAKQSAAERRVVSPS